jgi:hypothetical protein
MGTKINRKMKIAFIIITVIILSALIIGMADGVAPGSEQDPVVTQSYVELKSGQLKYYIDDLLAKINTVITKNSTDIDALNVKLEQKNQEIIALKTDIESLKQGAAGSQGSAKFVVVQAAKGKTVIGGDGSEIIVRSGKFTAVAGTNGSLMDATVGKDLKAGEAILNNHLLISSRNDGRGLKAAADAFLIIKGAYTIK